MPDELLKIIFFVDVEKRIWPQFLELNDLHVFIIRQTEIKIPGFARVEGKFRGGS
jgi:hypothetical protein